jgi:2-hydroxychromene-2-carboxylate isomerase
MLARAAFPLADRLSPAPETSMSAPILEFWHEFASTYSYPAAMRVERLARAKGVEVRWRPFLLGPIFAAQGYRTTPFLVHLAKGRNMWRDVARICARDGLNFVKPTQFPQNSVLAARVCLALPEDRRGAFARAAYALEFGEGADLGQRETIAGLLTRLGEDAEATLAHASSDPIKAALRQAVEAAQARGVYGSPSFLTEDGELFWGNDRLEHALDWACGLRWGLEDR